MFIDDAACRDQGLGLQKALVSGWARKGPPHPCSCPVTQSSSVAGD